MKEVAKANPSLRNSKKVLKQFAKLNIEQEETQRKTVQLFKGLLKQWSPFQLRYFIELAVKEQK